MARTKQDPETKESESIYTEKQKEFFREYLTRYAGAFVNVASMEKKIGAKPTRIYNFFNSKGLYKGKSYFCDLKDDEILAILNELRGFALSTKTMLSVMDKRKK